MAGREPQGGEPSGPSVEFDNVRRSFGDIRAVDGVSGKIPQGCFLALVGVSGSGKSTLLKTINRLIELDGGAVRINGEAVTDCELYPLRRSIGYVFQNIGLFPHMSVGDNFTIIARVSHDKSLGPARVAELLELVELPPGLAARMPHELSGGQRQRVGVARALVGQPGLMLMDEPFGALDPITREKLGETYLGLHRRFGLTTIMVTHDMAEALLLADRIWVMSEGRIVGDGTPREMVAGSCGEAAEALVAIPRAQAERVVALEKHEGPNI